AGEETAAHGWVALQPAKTAGELVDHLLVQRVHLPPLDADRGEAFVNVEVHEAHRVLLVVDLGAQGGRVRFRVRLPRIPTAVPPGRPRRIRNDANRLNRPGTITPARPSRPSASSTTCAGSIIPGSPCGEAFRNPGVRVAPAAQASTSTPRDS